MNNLLYCLIDYSDIPHRPSQTHMKNLNPTVSSPKKHETKCNTLVVHQHRLSNSEPQRIESTVSKCTSVFPHTVIVPFPLLKAASESTSCCSMEAGPSSADMSEPRIAARRCSRLPSGARRKNISSSGQPVWSSISSPSSSVTCPLDTAPCRMKQWGLSQDGRWL